MDDCQRVLDFGQADAGCILLPADLSLQLPQLGSCDPAEAALEFEQVLIEM